MVYNIFEKVWDQDGAHTFGAYEKDDEDEAYGLFHAKCATNRRNANCPRYLVTLFNDEGANYATEYRVKPISEPEEPNEGNEE